MFCEECSGWPEQPHSYLFFNLDSWPWVRAVTIQTDFLLLLNRRSELISRRETSLCCAATLPVLPFPAAGCACRSQQKATLKASQVSEGNTPLSSAPEAPPASRRSPCPERGADHPGPTLAAQELPVLGNAAPGWAPRGLHNQIRQLILCTQEAPSPHVGFQPEPHSDSECLQ